MTRHHAESNINILLTSNLAIDSNLRHRSHPLIIPLHCLWAKSNNRTCGQFECDVTWFCFCFDFVCSHARCGCCSIFCWEGCASGVHLKLNVQGQVGGKTLDIDGQGMGGGEVGWGILKTRQFPWTPYGYSP